jgi:hypothetical protein
MGDVIKYQNILTKWLESYAKKSKLANMPNVKNKVIADVKNNSFQLLRIGWEKEKFIFSVVFHFDIIDGKVWFQRNITENEVVDELVELGIPPNDIILGFQPPYARQFTGLAVA